MQFEDSVHLIFFAAAVQGMVLSLVCRKRAAETTAFLWLSGIFLTFSFILLHWVAFWQGLYQSGYGSIGRIAGTLDFALAPIIYFFIRSLQDPSFKFDRKSWWHFVPFLCFFLSSIALSTFTSGTDPITQNQSFFTGYRSVYLLIENGQFVAYGLWLYLQFRSSTQSLIKTLGMLFIIYFAGRLTYSVLALVVSMITPSIDYVLSVIISTSIFSIAYLNQLKPIHFHHRKSYEKSSLSRDHEHLISQEVVDHIVTQKRFLDNDYSIDLLSKELTIPRHHISQALNQHLGKSFSVLINELRIETSMQILQDPTRNHEKILGVAVASGFNNKVSFNKYFKAKTGVSPLEFRKRHLKTLEK